MITKIGLIITMIPNYIFCPATQRQAEFFCYTDDCTKPAFGCQLDELADHNHKNGKCNLWSVAAPVIRRAIQTELLQIDTIVLMKHDAQLRNLIDQLNTLQKSHCKAIQNCR